MGNFKLLPIAFVALTLVATTLPFHTQALMPYNAKSLWDMLMFPTEDPFRILEQTPIPKGVDRVVESLALARADWKETPTEHVITVEIPGMKKEDVKIEVEENRVLKVSGEFKAEEEVEGEKWHRAERTSGKFWRQFRLPANADLEKVKAHLGDGILKIVVPKFGEEKKRETKVVNIVEGDSSGENVKAINKSEL